MRKHVLHMINFKPRQAADKSIAVNGVSTAYRGYLANHEAIMIILLADKVYDLLKCYLTCYIPIVIPFFKVVQYVLQEFLKSARND